MGFLGDFLVVVLIIGIFTRLVIYFAKKKMELKAAIYFAHIFALILIGPIAVFVLGFDIAIAEVISALILWFLLDILWAENKKKRIR